MLQFPRFPCVVNRLDSNLFKHDIYRRYLLFYVNYFVIFIMQNTFFWERLGSHQKFILPTDCRIDEVVICLQGISIKKII